MVRYIQAGFDADDQTREYVHEAVPKVDGACCATMIDFDHAILWN